VWLNYQGVICGRFDGGNEGVYEKFNVEETTRYSG